MAFLLSALLFLTSAQTEQEVKHPITGVFKGEIKDPVKKDVIMKVAMQAPSKLPEHKVLGLIVLHHGFNGNENNYFGGAVECAKRLGLSDQYVIIAGKSRGAGWDKADDEYVLRLIQWAKDTYPIDPRRVYEWGSSNGAAFVGRFGWHHQDLFAAVVGYCGSYNSFQDPPECYKAKPGLPGPAAETKTEWYFVHGGNDNPDNSRKALDVLKQKGYRGVFRKLDGYGHTDIWDGQGHPDLKLVDAVRDDWFLFMHSLRHKEIAPSKEEKAALAAMPGKIKSDKALVAEAARIGGVPASKLIDGAFDSTEADVRLAAAESTEKTFYSKELLIELVKLSKDKTEEMKLAALRGLGMASNYRHPEAQDTLVRLARTKSLALAERVAAVEGLGRTVKLMLPGNFEDKAVIWTLVTLLDDDELKIREAAFAAFPVFKEFVKETYDYKPDLPTAERKASVAKWKNWCTKVAGPLEGKP
jgi:pimeloyl-ACP methyl ester carboxylesterase